MILFGHILIKQSCGMTGKEDCDNIPSHTKVWELKDPFMCGTLVNNIGQECAL